MIPKWMVQIAILSLVASPALADAAGSQASESVVYKVGQVTRHAAKFEGKQLVIQGYVLVPGKDYVLFSDEASGKVGAHDLPVIGPGISSMRPNVKYRLVGTFLRGGLVSSNGNPDHLELIAPPAEIAE